MRAGSPDRNSQEITSMDACVEGRGRSDGREAHVFRKFKETYIVFVSHHQECTVLPKQQQH